MRSSLATAATAVVLEPFASSMTDTRSGPKNALRTAARSFSPAGMSVPPMKTAVWCRSFGPASEDGAVDEIADRVLDRHHRSSSPRPRRASYATTRSKTLGCDELSS